MPNDPREIDPAVTFGIAQAGLALETRVGSGIWITRTKGLIDRISAETPA